MTRPGLRTLFLLLFALSGFAGLIYESIWSHYLKLFLGHAAYAQTLVLSIFMGGMAVGSWLSSRMSQRWPNLLLAYAIAELIIGLLGVVFHGVFVHAVEFVFVSALPVLQDPLLASIAKWSMGTMLILPQSVLLGMTFPLMSAGLIRRFPATPGATLAMLYFTNSIGASIGVLISGFVLIDAVGLPGTILTAGLINVALAVVVWALLKKQPPESRTETSVATTVTASRGGYRLLLVIALITGLSSFMYEIGWIRMLALVLGASTHSFELMLSAFILGLALGGFWIRNRIDASRSPERLLAVVQIAMGILALLSIPLYNYTFDVMEWLLQAVQRNSGGYDLFNLTSHVIAFSVMVPATFCAGMTLPLITYALLREGHGEKSIGAVYATNTAGAIAGIFLAVHLAMPLLGLKGLIVLGATLDLLLGVILFLRTRAIGTVISHRHAIAWVLAGAGAMIGITLFAAIDPLKAASGVYRVGTVVRPGSPIKVLYHRDGKTASVDLLLDVNYSSINISTNGKPDASMQLDVRRAPSLDEPTMILAAALPMLHHPTAQSVAVIGLGSGLTTNTFLANPALARVDTIEIEPAMVAGAQGFRPRTEGVYTDPRSRIHIEDAKTYFSTHNTRYDIIASEPSNPWVSGVASLFTDEFYRHARRYLNDDGLLVQWLQVYEIDTPLVMSVLKALSNNFPDYAIYTSGHTDTIIVAKKSGKLGELDLRRISELGLRPDLDRIGIHTAQDLWQRRVATRKTLEPLVATWPVSMNSDYFPILDQNATRTRFLQRLAYELVDLANSPLPLLEMLGEPQLPRQRTEVTASPAVSRSVRTATAAALLDYVADGRPGSRPAIFSREVSRDTDYFRFAAMNCRYLGETEEWEQVLFNMSGYVNAHLTSREAERFWRSSEIDRCIAQMHSLHKDWYLLYKAIAARDAAAMASIASSLLQSGEAGRSNRGDYLFAAAMLGHIASGNRQAARILWAQYALQILGSRPIPFSLRLLEAHSRKPESS